MNIYVDGDACPVKDLVIEVGKRHGVAVIIICSLSHYTSNDDKAEYIIVDNIPQAADMAIANRVKAGDVVITQDYGLAALVIGKGCFALHHTGKKYTQDNIDQLLFKRHLAQKVRSGGGKTKGPKAFSKQDKKRFKEVLEKLVSQLKKE